MEKTLAGAGLKPFFRSILCMSPVIACILERGDLCIKFQTMKSKLFYLTLLLLGGFVLFQACKSSQKTSATDSSYACPMHPEVTGNKGDRCAKCQMELKESHAPAVFCCPIHRECTSKMRGNCPKCGTPMEQPVLPYICPMHPEQKGIKGDRCPKCNMPLEPQTPGKGVG